MSLALVHSRARAGVHAPPVQVEVHLSGGLPSTQIVGLPEAAVRESRDRVRAALLCAQFEYPARRITINLAPADLPKEGGRFDLPIALGILAASGQIDRNALAGHEFIGELALTGELRAVDGALPAAIAAAQARRTLIIAPGNGEEASLARHADVRIARTLLEVCAGLAGSKELPAAKMPAALPLEPLDLSDVRGQQQARRALEIAAAGAHHLLLLGSPGCGKTLLASRLPGILPEASEAEALETAAIASLSGRGVDPARWRHRPYRAPHHTASAVALAGGGSHPRPGEISLAHNGVLFLDELPVRLSSCLSTLELAEKAEAPPRRTSRNVFSRRPISLGSTTTTSGPSTQVGSTCRALTPSAPARQPFPNPVTCSMTSPGQHWMSANLWTTEGMGFCGNYARAFRTLFMTRAN